MARVGGAGGLGRGSADAKLALYSTHVAVLQLKCPAKQCRVADRPGEANPRSGPPIRGDVCFALVDEADKIAVFNGNMKNDIVCRTFPCQPV